METESTDIMQTRIIELEEQLKLSQSDLSRKDDIIKDLSSMEIKHGGAPGAESSQCRAELASIQLQMDSTAEKLRESEIELRGRDEQLAALRATSREQAEQLAELAGANAELQARLSAGDQTSGELNCANARAELAIAALQKELAAATERICALETDIRETGARGDDAARTRDGAEAALAKLQRDLRVQLALESDAEPALVFDKIRALTAENNAAKGELANLRAVAAERENKYLEQRDSHRALLQAVEKERGGLEDYISMKRELTFELDRAQLEKKAAEHKQAELARSVGELEAALHDARQLLDEKEARLAKLGLEKRESGHAEQQAARELDQFREALAGLLGSSLSRCAPSEHAIKERVRALVADARDKDNTIGQLDTKLRALTEQYERSCESSKETGVKARRVELEYLDLKDRIRQLEKELSARDVTRDLLRAEKERILHFLRRLASLFQMDPVGGTGTGTGEFDLELACTGLLNRAGQLVRAEGERNLDTSHTIAGLQKRLRDTKDKLHSRDLHLEMMRRKLCEQDDRLREAGADADARRDLLDGEAELKVKLAKMQKRVDTLRDENKALKAELFECSDAKIAANNEVRELETLRHNLQKLERVRQKQAERIADLTKSVELHDSEASQSRLVADGAVQSLTGELRAMRTNLERARRSEKELLDFRAVVGRVLGLCVDELAVPNYDIIRRLQKLAGAPHAGVTVAVPVPFHPAARPGLEDASRLLGRRRRSPARTAHQESGRPRSVSPVHEPLRDSRKY